MKALGLDPSMNATGLVALSAINCNEWSVEKSIELTSDKKLGRFVRMDQIASNMLNFIHAWRPDVVMIEGYSYGSPTNLATAAELGAVLRWFCLQADLKVYEVPPSTLKKWVTLKGNAPKEEMMLQVYKRWGFEPATHNIADAFGLAILGVYMQEKVLDPRLPKAQREVLLAMLKQGILT